MTVRGSEESVEARLRSGLVACWCGGTLRPWGRARTASSWLSRFAARAGWLRAGLLRLLPLADPQARPVAAAGPAAGDALAALEAVTAGLRRRFGGLATVAAHEVAAHLTGGMLLAPPLPALAGNTTLIAMAAVPPS